MPGISRSAASKSARKASKSNGQWITTLESISRGEVTQSARHVGEVADEIAIMCQQGSPKIDDVLLERERLQ